MHYCFFRVLAQYSSDGITSPVFFSDNQDKP